MQKQRDDRAVRRVKPVEEEKIEVVLYEQEEVAPADEANVTVELNERDGV